MTDMVIKGKRKPLIYYKFHEHQYNRWWVIKLNDDFEVEGRYEIIRSVDVTGKQDLVCTCPSWRNPCKHVLMWRDFNRQKAFGTNKVYDPVKGRIVELDL